MSDKHLSAVDELPDRPAHTPDAAAVHPSPDNDLSDEPIPAESAKGARSSRRLPVLALSSVVIFTIGALGLLFLFAPWADVDGVAETHPGTDSSPLETSSVTSDPHASDPSAAAGMTTSMDSLAADIAGLRSAFDSLQVLLQETTADQKELSDRLAAHAAGADRVIASLDERLSALESGRTRQIDAVEANMSSLEGAINDLKKTAGANKRRILGLSRRNRQSGPPFHLVSIDEWGGVVSAVLEMAGVTTVAAVGDERAGWRVIKIARPCVHVVRVAGGNESKVCGRSAR